ncbi:glycosyltransferase [Bacillus thuringiensis]|nr:glycosyltransferase [Bacillus thuringiensis]
MEYVLWICAVISIPLVFLYYMYTTFISLLPTYVAQDISDSALKQEEPYFVFCIPCLNEAKVIKKTVEALLQLDYERFFIVVIDDASDDDTVQVVRQIDDTRVRLHQRRHPHAQLGKGEALNDAYQKICKAVRRLSINSEQVILTIVDGDGRPSQNLLQEARRAFSDPAVGAAQTTIRMTNRKHWLSLMQDVEFSANVATIQNSREYLQSVGLGGNGQFSRLSAMQELGPCPWSNCLLEDFDFGLSLLLRGWKIRHVSNSTMYQQGLISLSRYIRQRSRWAQGNLQCFRRMKEILNSDISIFAKIDLCYFLLQPWTSLVGSFVMIISWIYLGVFLYSYDFRLFTDSNQWLWNISSLILWMLLVFSPGVLWGIRYYRNTQQEEQDPCSFKQCILVGISMPVYTMLVIPSVWIAYWRQLTKKTRWLKTERVEETH